jgi:hypothetical protein
MSDKKAPQEHPLANILINVLIPVLVLSFLSKDPAIQDKLNKPVHFWHIGPLYAMIVALVLPLGYGIRHFVMTRKPNFFSGLGLASIVLTGGLTLYLWNADGSVKHNAGLLLGLKEASIPLVLGIAILTSAKSKSPLLNVFLYNDNLFDIPKIETKIKELGNLEAYQSLLAQSTRLFSASFFLSSLMNLGLALWFFQKFDHSAIDALETYNALVGKLTGWGFAVIGLPILVFLFLILRRLLKGLNGLTGLTDEELMLPR